MRSRERPTPKERVSGAVPAPVSNSSTGRDFSIAGPAMSATRAVARLPAAEKMIWKFPSWRTSPAVRREAASIRRPFTLVPFFEPRSSTHQAPSLKETRACWREMDASVRTTMFSRERPMVPGTTGSSGTRSPSAAPWRTTRYWPSPFIAR